MVIVAGQGIAYGCGVATAFILLNAKMIITTTITTAPYNFLLPDYDNIEFPFGPQIKALYLLFLTHPEGIRMKEIEDYKEEYKQLYFLMTTRSDINKIRASVEKLMDVCSPNIISVKKSQCNSMIREALPYIEVNFTR